MVVPSGGPIADTIIRHPVVRSYAPGKKKYPLNPIAAKMFALLRIRKVHHLEMLIFSVCPVPRKVPSPGLYRSISRRNDNYKRKRLFSGPSYIG